VSLDSPTLRVVQAAAFPFPSPQGSQVFVRGMARALAARSHSVTVVCYGHGEGEVDPEYRVVRTPKIPGYNNLRAGPDLVKPFLDVALAQRIASIDADVVHAHNYEAAIAASVAKKFTGIPVVYNAHNTMGEELPSYFRGVQQRAVAGRFGRWLDRTVPKMADHAVVLNPSAVSTLQGLGCDAVSCVPPGVDCGELDDVVPAVLSDGPWVVYAGNPDRYQDLDVLIEAMRLIPEAGLLMVSAAPMDNWENCGLARIRCVQTSDFNEVKALIAAAEVAALPRTVCSGFPIKLLNYLGLGVPTVVAEGSAPEMPGVLSVKNRDAKTMASAIRGLLEDPTHRASLANDARAHVREACTWDARARELEAIYATVLAVQ
jgi:1,2-diacylglycerol 3-alpha-glucosyltransferase